MGDQEVAGREETVARTALAEITPAETIGALLERRTEDDGVLTLSFAALLSGYPGWHWSVSLAELPDAEPTVLEAELLPGDGALLAPDWVPWAERLEEYRAAQAAAAAEAGEDDEREDDADADDLDGDDLDGDDDDLDGEDDDLDEDDYDIDPDDAVDGIDFESALDDAEDADDSAVAAARVDEQDEAEPEADDDGPEQPAES